MVQVRSGETFMPAQAYLAGMGMPSVKPVLVSVKAVIPPSDPPVPVLALVAPPAPPWPPAPPCPPLLVVDVAEDEDVDVDVSPDVVVVPLAVVSLLEHAAIADKPRRAARKAA